MGVPKFIFMHLAQEGCSSIKRSCECMGISRDRGYVEKHFRKGRGRGKEEDSEAKS